MSPIGIAIITFKTLITTSLVGFLSEKDSNAMMTLFHREDFDMNNLLTFTRVISLRRFVELL